MNIIILQSKNLISRNGRWLAHDRVQLKRRRRRALNRLCICLGSREVDWSQIPLVMQLSWRSTHSQSAAGITCDDLNSCAFPSLDPCERRLSERRQWGILLEEGLDRLLYRDARGISVFKWRCVGAWRTCVDRVSRRTVVEPSRWVSWVVSRDRNGRNRLLL